MESRKKLISCLGYALRLSGRLHVPDTTRHLSLALHGLRREGETFHMPEQSHGDRKVISIFDAIFAPVDSHVSTEPAGSVSDETEDTTALAANETGITALGQIEQVVKHQCQQMVSEVMRGQTQEMIDRLQGLCTTLFGQQSRLNTVQDRVHALNKQGQEQIVEQETRLAALERTLHGIKKSVTAKISVPAHACDSTAPPDSNPCDLQAGSATDGTATDRVGDANVTRPPQHAEAEAQQRAKFMRREERRQQLMARVGGPAAATARGRLRVDRLGTTERRGQKGSTSSAGGGF
eukprot:Skav201591  [mRNA]  locus=scaffold152:569259:577712:+ [translate_table: standard]